MKLKNGVKMSSASSRAVSSSKKQKWDNKEYVLFRVKKNGATFEYASERLQSDKEVLMAALKSSPNVLRWASKELKSDREVILKALELKSSTALFFADDSLRNDEEIVLKALSGSVLSMMHVGNELRSNFAEYLKNNSCNKVTTTSLLNQWFGGFNVSIEDFSKYLKIKIEEKKALAEKEILESKLLVESDIKSGKLTAVFSEIMESNAGEKAVKVKPTEKVIQSCRVDEKLPVGGGSVRAPHGPASPAVPGEDGDVRGLRGSFRL